MRLVFLFLIAAASGTATAANWSHFIIPDSFVRSELPRPGDAEAIRRGKTLSGASKDWGIVGWVEYEFTVPGDGWYELLVYPSGSQNTEFIVDPHTENRLSFFGTANSVGGRAKVGNIWLKSGNHILRVQHHHWVGFPRISSMEIRAGGPDSAKRVALSLGTNRRLFRPRQCPELQLQFGGLDQADRVVVTVQRGENTVHRTELQAKAAPYPSLTKIPLPCSEEGRFLISLGDQKSKFSWNEVRPIDYEVIGETRDTALPNPKPRALVQAIDGAVDLPDYQSGATSVVRSLSGNYRESEHHGFTRWQRAPELARRLLPEPSWFGYRLGPLEPQQRYTIEIDYPDNALRTFAIALRESSPLSYPLSSGIDSGGSLFISGQEQILRMTYWPRTSDPRIVFMNVHDDRRIAVGGIRIFKDAGSVSPIRPIGDRMFINWFEEGDNFFSIYGAPDHARDAQRVAIERWTSALLESGANVFVPTVGIYSFSLYPSRYMRTFSRPDYDLLLRLLLLAEKHNLKVLPELHPRADDIDLPFSTTSDPKLNLLVSKDGKTNYYAGDGITRHYPPLHNPIHPHNKQWYLGLIEELATNYRDSPAMIGISLRLMPWANPSLNNFHSLEWGYDDYTVSQFSKETGLAVPFGRANDPGRFSFRYKWLMSNARERWIQWRCDKITDLYIEIRDRLRRINPRLTLYTTVFPWNDRSDTAQAWREAGVDLQRIAALEHVAIIDADQGFGRREADAAFEQRQRGKLLDPANLGLPADKARSYLTGTYYLEATEAVVPPAAIGFPSTTKRTWTSAVAVPAGRNALEPYALQLAKTDATLLGVGGNGYTLGNHLLREFLEEYRRLPSEKFRMRSATDSSVVIRDLSRTGELLVYAVNTKPSSARVEITFTGMPELTRLRNDEKLSLKKGRLVFELDGFGMKAFRAVGNTQIETIHAEHSNDAIMTIAAPK